MSACSVPLLPLCSTPNPFTREGYVDVQHAMYLPFYQVNGNYTFWRADGAVQTFNDSTVAQDSARLMNGTFIPSQCGIKG